MNSAKFDLAQLDTPYCVNGNYQLFMLDIGHFSRQIKMKMRVDYIFPIVVATIFSFFAGVIINNFLALFFLGEDTDASYVDSFARHIHILYFYVNSGIPLVTKAVIITVYALSAALSYILMRRLIKKIASMGKTAVKTEIYASGKVVRELNKESQMGPLPVATAAPSAAEEIKKLGELLAAGLLTQEEFDRKKAQILA